MLSAMVERLGPVIGGVLGCVPHVAVVGSIGFLLQTASSDEFRIAMLSMPLGMLCNGVLEVGKFLQWIGWLEWFPVFFWCDVFLWKRREVGEKNLMFSGQKVALVHTCWMHSHMVETLRLPLLGCSTGLFSSNVRGGKRLRVDSHFALLVELYVPGSVGQKSGHQSSAFANGGT